MKKYTTFIFALLATSISFAADEEPTRVLLPKVNVTYTPTSQPQWSASLPEVTVTGRREDRIEFSYGSFSGFRHDSGPAGIYYEPVESLQNTAKQDKKECISKCAQQRKQDEDNARIALAKLTGLTEVNKGGLTAFGALVGARFAGVEGAIGGAAAGALATWMITKEAGNSMLTVFREVTAVRAINRERDCVAHVCGA